ncbi:DUF6338 family protein [Lentzea sp. NPDC054927]
MPWFLTTRWGVLVFLLFVVPGTCYELLRGRTMLPREESAFQQISRVLLFGSVISALVGLTLAGIGVGAPGSLLNASKLLSGGTGYVAANTSQAGWTIALFLILSLLYAVITNDLRTSDGAPAIHQADAWHSMAHVLPALYLDGPHQVTVSVRLKCGRDVVGRWLGSSTELDPSKRELTLQAPLVTRESGDEEEKSFDEDWAVMTIVGSEIESIAFAYSPKEGAEKQLRNGIRRLLADWLRRHWTDWQFASSVAIAVVMLAVLLG